MCAGYSLALSTFRPDGSLRPFAPTARRLGFILVCAYLLHAPGLTLAEWTVLGTPQKYRELFKIDVLQCIVFSLLILQGLARLIRRPMAYAGVALALAAAVALAAPAPLAAGGGGRLLAAPAGPGQRQHRPGRHRPVPAGALVRLRRVRLGAGGALPAPPGPGRVPGRARWSEGRWLLGPGRRWALLLRLWGSAYATTWLLDGSWSASELGRLHNTTLPSIAQRLGVVCLAGSALGWIEAARGRWPGPNLVKAASAESLLVYMLHLNLIFGLLLAAPVRTRAGWQWHSLGWTGTLALTAAVIAASLAAAVWWQRMRREQRARRLQRAALMAFCVCFLAGGWITYHHFRRSPELATEPYAFLSAARARKGLPPTPDGLSRDPEEGAREKLRLKGGPRPANINR